MNWGYKITLLYLGFVGMIMFFVISASSQKFHLVSKDYYQEELAYEERINKLKNTRELGTKVDIAYSAPLQQVAITFPQVGDVPTGEVVFFRPSDARLDQRFPIQLNSDSMLALDVKGLAKGLWKVQVDWVGGDTPYFQEENLILR